ncbi:hypothetical protein HMPREF1415_01716, partial [Helicobacter pylori GAM254Ai]
LEAEVIKNETPFFKAILSKKKKKKKTELERVLFLILCCF